MADPNAPVSPASSHSADAEVGLGAGRPGARDAEDGEAKRSGGCCGFGKKPMNPLQLREENDRRRTMGMPLLGEEEALTRKEAKTKRKQVGGEGEGGRDAGWVFDNVLTVWDASQGRPDGERG